MPHLRWWLLLAGGALLVLVNLAVLSAQESRGGAGASSPDASAGAARCPGAEAVSAPTLAEAAHPAVLWWADGEVRLFVDEQPAGTEGQLPRHFAPGEHTVRVEAPGAAPLSMTLRLEPWEPAMLHAELHPSAGLTVVFLGAECLVCGPRRAAPFTLAPPKGEASGVAPLAEAAQALRDADTDRAAALLSSVGPSRRGEPLFRRLAAWLHAATGQASAARPELERAAEAAVGSQLPAQWKLFAQTQARERERRAEVALRRWNLLTARYGRLVARFPQAAPGQTHATGARLEELGAQVNDALHVGDAAGQERLVAEGEAAVRAWVRALRAQAPADCAFQAKVTAEL